MTPPDRELGAGVPGGAEPPDAMPATAAPAMRRFLAMLGEVARHDAPVLLLGESGTGKTALARALHARSARASAPFVRVDCAAGAGDLAGQAQAARLGTLFLDEVTGLSPGAQITALRLLQDALRPPQPSARFIASGHLQLEGEIAAGRFRRDLFYRLAVVELRIPPLRDRAEDILPTARAFLAARARATAQPAPHLPPDLERALAAYPWPGNLTELFSVLEHMAILARGRTLDLAALPERMRAGRGRSDLPEVDP